MSTNVVNRSRIDPQLLAHAAQTAQDRWVIEDDPGSPDGETSKKRRKLNVWKCKQCREARKKCYPVNRVWPQKCDRCLQHKPDELECSEPQLNDRKRGPNLPKTGRRSNTRATSEKSDLRSLGSDSESPDELEIKPSYSRPGRTSVVNTVKKEDAAKLRVSLQPNQHILSDQSQAYTYQPLYPGNIRILRLNPGSKDAKIQCSFLSTPLTQGTEYEAISHYWGIDAPTLAIYIQDSQLETSRTHQCYVRANLYSALQSLRHPSDTMHFWVDALCINHDDLREKSQQIQLMPDIFYKAKNVCIWLGPDIREYKVAFSFIPRMIDFLVIDKIIQDESTIESWLSFCTLLQNVLFSRLWLVQEVAVARNATLHCGQLAIHYLDFVDAVSVFSFQRDNIRLLLRKNARYHSLIFEDRSTTAERFVKVTSSALLKGESGDILERSYTIETLVSLLSGLQTSEPRDSIYALLGLAKDGPQLVGEKMKDGLSISSPFEITHNASFSRPDDILALLHQPILRIDYSIPVSEVFGDFVEHVIVHSRSLDIICRRWVKPQAGQLPTWLQAISSGLLRDPEMESFVGLPGHKTYNATMSLPPQTSKNHFHTGDSLFVCGFEVAAIDQIGPRASEGMILREWLELGDCDVSEENVFIPDKFWRTVVADRGSDGSNAPSWYQRAMLHCLMYSPTNRGDINTSRILDDQEGQSSMIGSFLRRVQRVIWNRKLFIARSGSLGLAPSATQIGDKVCILFGCSVPVILRPRHGSDGRQHWSFIGECYVHGMMDGQAVESTRVDGFCATEFELR